MTISRQLFLEHWKRLCRRFGREFSKDNLDDANDYHAFLSARMSPEEFEEAAQAVWASSKFWPRPADFLGVQASREWRTVLDLSSNFDRDTWAQLTTAAKLATEAVGGTEGIRRAKDVVRLRSVWLDAYEGEVKASAGDFRLPSSADRALPGADEPKRIDETRRAS